MKDGSVRSGETLANIPVAMQTCQAGTVEEYQKLKSLVEVFATPESFAYDVGKSLLINGHDIYEEINHAVKDWDREDW